MTVYVTTVKSLGALPKDALPSDRVLLFYRDVETMKVGDVAGLLALEPEVVFTSIADRDDMLVCLSVYLATELGESDVCRILDDSIPVPKRYADKIEGKGKSVKRDSRSSKSRPKKTKPVETSAPAQTEKPAEVSVADGKTEEPAGEPMMPEPAVSDEAKAEYAATVEEPESTEPVTNEGTTEPAEKSEPSFFLGDDEEINDKEAKALFDLIHVTSKDVGFSWNTEMLMLKILQYVSVAEDDADMEMSINTIRNGSKIWKKMLPHLDEIKKLAD